MFEPSAWANARLVHMQGVERLDGMQSNVRESGVSVSGRHSRSLADCRNQLPFIGSLSFLPAQIVVIRKARKVERKLVPGEGNALFVLCLD